MKKNERTSRVQWAFAGILTTSLVVLVAISYGLIGAPATANIGRGSSTRAETTVGVAPSVNLLNDTLTVRAGATSRISFDISSPVLATYDFAIASAGASLSTSAIVDGTVPLPQGVAVGYPEGRTMATSSAEVSLPITIAG